MGTVWPSRESLPTYLLFRISIIVLSGHIWVGVGSVRFFITNITNVPCPGVWALSSCGRPSSVHRLWTLVLGNGFMIHGQLLWDDTYQLYLQTIFFFVFKIFKFSISFTIFCFLFCVNIGPYGRKISKRYSSSFRPIWATVAAVLRFPPQGQNMNSLVSF